MYEQNFNVFRNAFWENEIPQAEKSAEPIENETSVVKQRKLRNAICTELG